MLKERIACLIGSLLIAVVGLITMSGMVRADPANAVLTMRVSNRYPANNEVVTVTFLLTEMDPEEAFYDWKVRLGYSSTVLTPVPESCWFNPEVWFSDTFNLNNCDIAADNVYVGEENYAGHSVTDSLILLGSVSFTVTGDVMLARSHFDLITDTQGDTNFFRPDITSWQPGHLNYEDPNAVTFQHLAAGSSPGGGAGVAAGAALVVAAAVALRRRRRFPRS
ncbi:MAG: hypothetical protein JXA21_08725 [Anaerolineae bacterium]|nr:hypothetical protein [Anaerolineae bacterium]